MRLIIRGLIEKVEFENFTTVFARLR